MLSKIFPICMLVSVLLFGEQVETFYGAIEVNEPILLELIRSPAMQRLKEINQYGVSIFTIHREKYTRYDHSVGVFKKNDATLEEQISGFGSVQLISQEQSSGWRTELQQIDDELDELEDTQSGYLSTARRLDDKAMSWQSQDQTQEAKRAYQRADDYRQAAKMLQPRIDALKARRAQILQEHSE